MPVNDTTTDYLIAPCGHFVCPDCFRRMVSMCPVCRRDCASDAWSQIADVRRRMQGEHTPTEAGQKTSGKLMRLKEIVDGIGSDGRILVICPLRSMLADVRSEMKNIGITLAMLDGSTSQLQGTLRRWQKGACKGLLSAPDIPSLNLSEASTIVFLSPLMTDAEYTQATGRVVREGSDGVRRGESVRVFILGSKDTIETNELRVNHLCNYRLLSTIINTRHWTLAHFRDRPLSGDEGCRM